MKHAVVVLDETGSMSGQGQRVVSSLNEYVAALPGKTQVSVFSFDSERWRAWYEGRAREWTDFTTLDYRPRAMTNLFDSIARGIAHADATSKAGDKVMVMIDTDGQENASKEQTFESVSKLIKARKKQGWEFLFMASGLTEQAAAGVGKTGQNLGIRTLTAAHQQRGQVYAFASARTCEYFSGSEDKKSA